MNTHTLIVLGRYGDIINCLPMAYAFHKRGGRLRWLVSEEYASILDGVSYVDAEVWPGSQDTLHRAIQHVRRKGQRALVAQAWMNPDQQHRTDSFAKEQWRLAGMLDHYGRFPLVFDRRFPKREAELLARVGIPNNPDYYKATHEVTFDGKLSEARPIVLVATTSVSTPYKYADKLIATLRGMDAEIIDMDNVRASNVFDLLGLFERADCLVSVDTMHHHLARASYLPVVYLQNDGWKGANPVPQVRASWRYAEIEDLSQVKAATESVVSRSCRSLQVVVHTYSKGHTERHARAMATHPKNAIYAEVGEGLRLRNKELLSRALESRADGIVNTNDDVTFLPDTLERIKAHLSKWDYGCSRRPRDPVHIGREIFFYRTDWLKANLDKMPDPYWGLHKPDLILARYLRSLHGIRTTWENLNYDFAPVEIPAGLIEHEDHKSHWDTPEINNTPEGKWNMQLWEDYAEVPSNTPADKSKRAA